RMGAPAAERSATIVAPLPSGGPAHLPARLSLARPSGRKAGIEMNAGPNLILMPRSNRRKWAVPAALALIALILITAGLLANANRGPDLTRVREAARGAPPQRK